MLWNLLAGTGQLPLLVDLDKQINNRIEESLSFSPLERAGKPSAAPVKHTPLHSPPTVIRNPTLPTC